MGSKRLRSDRWSQASEPELGLDVLNLKINKMRKLFITCWKPAIPDPAKH